MTARTGAGLALFSKCHFCSVSEIEFCTLYVVAERWILGCILRFMRAKNHFSDTLIPFPFFCLRSFRTARKARRQCGCGVVISEWLQVERTGIALDADQVAKFILTLCVGACMPAS